MNLAEGSDQRRGGSSKNAIQLGWPENVGQESITSREDRMGTREQFTKAGSPIRAIADNYEAPSAATKPLWACSEAGQF